MRAAVLLALAVAATACGGDDVSAPSTSAAPLPAGDFCTVAQHYIETVEASPIFASAAEAEREEVVAVVDDLKSQLDQLEASAPAEIAVDVGLVVRGQRDLVTALEDNDYDFTALAADPALLELTEQFTAPAYVEATDHLRAYAEETCAITSVTAG